jgi:hypothetical protein
LGERVDFFLDGDDISFSMFVGRVSLPLIIQCNLKLI